LQQQEDVAAPAALPAAPADEPADAPADALVNDVDEIVPVLGAEAFRNAVQRCYEDLDSIVQMLDVAPRWRETVARMLQSLTCNNINDTMVGVMGTP
jgi:hypothetical protein